MKMYTFLLMKRFALTVGADLAKSDHGVRTVWLYS